MSCAASATGRASGAQERPAAPGAEFGQIGVIGDQDEGVHINHEVQNEVVFEVVYFVHGSWRVDNRTARVLDDFGERIYVLGSCALADASFLNRVARVWADHGIHEHVDVEDDACGFRHFRAGPT